MNKESLAFLAKRGEVKEKQQIAVTIFWSRADVLPTIISRVLVLTVGPDPKNDEYDIVGVGFSNLSGSSRNEIEKKRELAAETEIVPEFPIGKTMVMEFRPGEGIFQGAAIPQETQDKVTAVFEALSAAQDLPMVSSSQFVAFHASEDEKTDPNLRRPKDVGEDKPHAAFLEVPESGRLPPFLAIEPTEKDIPTDRIRPPASETRTSGFKPVEAVREAPSEVKPMQMQRSTPLVTTPPREPKISTEINPSNETPSGVTGEQGRNGDGGNSNTQPPPQRKPERRGPSWPVCIGLVCVAILVTILLSPYTCEGDGPHHLRGGEEITVTSTITPLGDELPIRLPMGSCQVDCADPSRTMDLKVQETKHEGNTTANCSPSNGKTLYVWVHPDKEKVITAKSQPGLQEDVGPAAVTIIKLLPVKCKDAKGKKIDWEEIRKLIQNDPEANAHVDEMIKLCSPVKNKNSGSGESESASRAIEEEPVGAATPAEKKECKRGPRPSFVSFTGLTTDINGKREHLEGQGKSFGAWCAECPGFNCAAECQKAANGAKLEFNDHTRFTDPCRDAARNTADKKAKEGMKR